MANNRGFVALQQLLDLKQNMGPELYLAFDLLATRLNPVYEASSASNNNSARQRAELREAKKIILQLKNPDPETLIRNEEMAWALYTVIEACNEVGVYPAVAILSTAARALGLNVAAHHEIPRDLDKQIGNAVKVLVNTHDAVPFMAAAG